MARKQPTKAELLRMADRLTLIRKNHAARMRRYRAKLKAKKEVAQ